MPKINQSGFAHALLLVLLLGGLAFGVYLVQQKTNIFSKASYSLSSPISGPVGGILASVNVSPGSAQAGSVVTVSWSGISRPAVKDWISINEKPSNKRVHWFFLNSCNQKSTSTPLSSGSCQITLPHDLLPAEHELRMLTDNSNDILLAKTSLNVLAPNAGITNTTVSVSPSTVAPGGNVTVTWANIAGPRLKDWVALYKTGEPDKGYRNWLFIGSCSRTARNVPITFGSCSLQIPANSGNGTYEIRLFSNNGYGRLAVSSPFTVGTSSSAYTYPTPYSTPSSSGLGTGSTAPGSRYPTPSSRSIPSENTSPAYTYPTPESVNIPINP